MKFAFILFIVLLSSIVVAQKEQLYLITISIENNTAKIIDKQLAEGYRPQTFDGGTYVIKNKDFKILQRGNFALPKAIVMEKFHSDNTIEGDVVQFSGNLSIIIPVLPESAEVSFYDEHRKKLASVELGDNKKIETSNNLWLYSLITLTIIVIIAIKIFLTPKRKKPAKQF